MSSIFLSRQSWRVRWPSQLSSISVERKYSNWLSINLLCLETLFKSLVLLPYPECFSDTDCSYGTCTKRGLCKCALGQVKDGKTCKRGKNVFLQKYWYRMTLLRSDLIRGTFHSTIKDSRTFPTRVNGVKFLFVC